MDKSVLSVGVLGLGFMLLFTAFQTMGNIEKVVIDSIARDDTTFSGDGYVSLAIIYATFAICNWLAPSVVALLGPRGAMRLGSLTYCIFTASFLWPQTWLLYAGSALLGIGAAVTWNGQGVYLSRCSNSSTISRNSAIFWAMLQASMLLGNAFVWREFSGKTEINVDTRTLLFSVLVVVALLGVFVLFGLPEHKSAHKPGRPLAEIHSAMKLLVTPKMGLLSITFLYSGMELSFFSGVYSPTVGFTNALGAKHLVGLSGVCIGLGEVVGGIACGLAGTKLRRDAILFGGYIFHAIAFATILINLPDAAVFGETDATSLLNPPSAALALVAAFLLGLGDACFNTQIVALLGGVFASQSAAAFALFRFMQSLAAASGFAYSTVLGLRFQLALLATMGALGTLAFWRVEWRTRAEAETICTETEKKIPKEHGGSRPYSISAKMYSARDSRSGTVWCTIYDGIGKNLVPKIGSWLHSR
uniref:UNC93-like protein MFSD11 n=1 Tax=Lutzomyia longipalpis TaxID=7200 RepID=A0A7G3ANV6_LUTLO